MKKLLKYISIACIGAFALHSCSDDDEMLMIDSSAFVAPEAVSPLSGTAIALSEATQNDSITFEWSKAEYGVETAPKYALQLTTLEDKAFANAIDLTVVFNTSYTSTQKEINEALVGLGFEPGEEAIFNYRIVSTIGTANVNALTSQVQTLTATPFSTDLSTPWGLVGSATPNSWDGPDVPFWKTSTPNVFEAYADLTNGDDVGEIKIRKDNAWTEDFGGNITSSSATGFAGTLEKGGSNIPVTVKGSYKITIDLANLTFTAEKFKWGIVGSAAPNGWDGPDVHLNYDGVNNEWFVNNITLTEGMIKFRQNDDWGTNYGAGGTAGTIESGGSDIPVTAGKYNIRVNFDKLTYSITPA